MESIPYDILGPIFGKNETKLIERSLMLRVLETASRVKSYHT